MLPSVVVLSAVYTTHTCSMCDLKLQEYSWLVFLSIAGTSSSSNTLKIDDLCNELSTVSDWFQLGLKLGVPDYKLDEIQQSYPSEGCSRWKLEALKLWLQLKPNATWMSIVRALQRMEEKELAKRIRKKYMRRESSKPCIRAVLVKRTYRHHITSG